MHRIAARPEHASRVKDLDITVRDGRLTIKAERSEKKESKGRSEFSYGSFVRSVPLPASADEDDIQAHLRQEHLDHRNTGLVTRWGGQW